MKKTKTTITPKLTFTVESSFLIEMKKHLRIAHTSDDDLIKNEITTAVFNIFEMLLLIPSTDPNFPTSTDDLSERQKLAVKHLTTTYRENPDERIESRFIPQTKMLIERILGPELGFPSV